MLTRNVSTQMMIESISGKRPFCHDQISPKCGWIAGFHEVICSGAIEYIVQRTKFREVGTCVWRLSRKNYREDTHSQVRAWNPYFGDVTAEKVEDNFRKVDLHFYQGLKDHGLYDSVAAGRFCFVHQFGCVIGRDERYL